MNEGKNEDRRKRSVYEMNMNERARKRRKSTERVKSSRWFQRREAAAAFLRPTNETFESQNTERLILSFVINQR